MKVWAVRQLKSYIILHVMPDGERYYAIYEVNLIKLAKKYECSLHEMMIYCLKDDIWPERFRSNRGILDYTDQIRLLVSSVAIFGLGGLGGLVALALARMGVGRLLLIDGDFFEEGNLSRQFLASLNTLGHAKVMTAVQNIIKINPVVIVKAHMAWASNENLAVLLKGTIVAVDGLDTLVGRYMLQEAVTQARMPMVHGAVAGLEGILMVIKPGDLGLRALYNSNSIVKSNSAEFFLGIPVVTPTMIANLQVNEVVKIILGRPFLGSGIVLYLNLETLTIEQLRVC